jgi:hypothetical protein
MTSNGSSSKPEKLFPSTFLFAGYLSELSTSTLITSIPDVLKG